MSEENFWRNVREGYVNALKFGYLKKQYIDRLRNEDPNGPQGELAGFYCGMLTHYVTTVIVVVYLL